MPPFWGDMRAVLVVDGPFLLHCVTLRAQRALPAAIWATIMSFR